MNLKSLSHLSILKQELEAEQEQKRRDEERKRLLSLADQWTARVEHDSRLRRETMSSLTPHDRFRFKQQRMEKGSVSSSLPIGHREPGQEKGFEAPLRVLIQRYGKGGWKEVFAHCTLGQVRRFTQDGGEGVIDTVTGLRYTLKGQVQESRKEIEPPHFTGNSGTVEIEPGNEVPLYHFQGVDLVEGGRTWYQGIDLRELE